MENLIELLKESLERLINIQQVADDSVSDYTLSIQVSIQFIKKALQTEDRLDIFKALQKIHDVLDAEYDETPEDSHYDNLVDRIENALNGLNENNMTDYIKAFGDDQNKKNLPVSFQPQDDWNFDHPINHNSRGKDTSGATEDHISFSTEENNDPKTNISQKELKEMVSSAVLHMMNAPINYNSLLEIQKQEIEKIISEYRNRPGIMSICFHEDIDKDETSVGMLIDPTNTQNWVFLKEEIVYKLPYSFKDSLHSFASKVWKMKDLVLESEVPPSEEHLRNLKQQVDNANRQADERYNEVAHQSTGYTGGNLFEPTRTNYPDDQEGHRNALSDGQYRELKKKAINLEVKYRSLLKKIKGN